MRSLTFVLPCSLYTSHAPPHIPPPLKLPYNPLQPLPPPPPARYRDILAKHSKLIVAELYGHINKGDIRLMDPKKLDTTDAGNDDALGDIGEDVGGGDGSTVSFTVTGISRRANNDPQFQRVLLNTKTSAIKDIEVYAMEKG